MALTSKTCSGPIAYIRLANAKLLTTQTIISPSIVSSQRYRHLETTVSMCMSMRVSCFHGLHGQQQEEHHLGPYRGDPYGWEAAYGRQDGGRTHRGGNTKEPVTMRVKTWLEGRGWLRAESRENKLERRRQQSARQFKR